MIFALRSLLPATLLLALALAHPLRAQRTLTGTVQDGQGTAVPFAVLELPTRKLGVQADDEGHFSLPLPANLTLTDSLTVSALGYVQRRVPVPAGATATLQLAALPVSLNEVVVRGTRAAPVIVGAREVNNRFMYGQSGLNKEKMTGWQIAYFIEGPPTGYVEEVRFYVAKKGLGNCVESVHAPFRVRLYALDSLTGTPGPDLLLTSVLTAATKPGWHTVDVRRFNIEAPHKGFFAAMEWVYTDDKYQCPHEGRQAGSKEKRIAISYGQTLMGAASLGHSYNYRAGRGWSKFQTPDAAIQVLIQQ